MTQLACISLASCNKKAAASSRFLSESEYQDEPSRDRIRSGFSALLSFRRYRLQLHNHPREPAGISAEPGLAAFGNNSADRECREECDGLAGHRGREDEF